MLEIDYINLRGIDCTTNVLNYVTLVEEQESFIQCTGEKEIINDVV